jgi:hypothetical protein
MRSPRLASWVIAAVFGLAGAAGVCLGQTVTADPVAGKATGQEIGNPANATCLACHGNAGFAVPGADGQMRQLHVVKDKFGKSVHGTRQCVECHLDITEIPHKPGVTHKVSCVTCHETLWEKARNDNKTQENARLGVVVQQIDRFMKSVHARPNKDDQSHTNATCYNCHDPHYVYTNGSPERLQWRLSIPNV